MLNVSVNTSNGNNGFLLRPTNNDHGPTDRRAITTGSRAVRVGNRRIFGFTVRVVNGATGHTLTGTGVGPRRLSVLFPRRTGCHVVASTTGHLGVPVSGI